MNMIVAVKLILKEGTTFDVYYLDGVVRRYDILWLAKKFPQLNTLKDRDLFLKGHLLGWSAIQWNDELDISVEDPYFDGLDVTKEYDDAEDVGKIYVRNYLDRKTKNPDDIDSDHHAFAKVLLMSQTIKLIADSYKISLEEARNRFYQSDVIKLLDDDETGLYGESALYLLSLYEREVANEKQNN